MEYLHFCFCLFAYFSKSLHILFILFYFILLGSFAIHFYILHSSFFNFEFFSLIIKYILSVSVFVFFFICRTVRYEDTLSWRWLWMYVHTCPLCILKIISIFFIFRIFWFLDSKSGVFFPFNLHLHFELPFFAFFLSLLFLLFI